MDISLFGDMQIEGLGVSLIVGSILVLMIELFRRGEPLMGEMFGVA